LWSCFCGAPSLTRGLVCSLITQWSELRRIRNHQVKSSYIMTDSQTASLSWCQAPLLEPVTNFSFFLHLFLDNYWFNDVGRLLWQEVGSEVWGHVMTDGQSVSMSWRRAHLGTCNQILSEFYCLVFVGRPLWREFGSVSCQYIIISKSKLLYDWQSVSMSWYQAPLWGLRSDIISCRNVAVWNLRSCICGAPSLMRRWVCNLRCNHSMVRVAQNP
jgi:hypothetical protein